MPKTRGSKATRTSTRDSEPAKRAASRSADEAKEAPAKKTAKKSKASDAGTSSSKGGKVEEAEAGEDDEEVVPNKTKTLPGCMIDEMLTGITTNPFLEQMPYTEYAVLHFDHASPSFKVTIKAGPASGFSAKERRTVHPDVGIASIGSSSPPKWLRDLIWESKPAENGGPELEDWDMPGSVVKCTFVKPIKVIDATYVNESRFCVKPGVAKREDKAEMEAKSLRLICEGHEGKEDRFEVRATRGLFPSPDASADEWDDEIIWPVNVDVKKTAA